jgi:hypothetical protein
LHYTVVSAPQQGKLTGTPPELTYTAEATASGSDSFTFKVNDGQKDSEQVALVSIKIGRYNQPPVAQAQTVEVTAGEARRIVLSGNDPEGMALHYAVVSAPQQGKLTGTPPELTYTAEATASGNDSFTFKVNDGQKDSEQAAVVSITIQNQFKLHVESAQAAVRAGNYTNALAEYKAAQVLRPNDTQIAAEIQELEPKAAEQNRQAKQAEETRKALAEQLHKLDAVFEVYLVWFKVLKPTDPHILTPEGRKAEPLGGAIGSQRDACLDQVGRLEAEYKKGGWLSQNDRQYYLDKLRNAIDRWE